MKNGGYDSHNDSGINMDRYQIQEVPSGNRAHYNHLNSPRRERLEAVKEDILEGMEMKSRALNTPLKKRRVF